MSAPAHTQSQPADEGQRTAVLPGADDDTSRDAQRYGLNAHPLAAPAHVFGELATLARVSISVLGNDPDITPAGEATLYLLQQMGALCDEAARACGGGCVNGPAAEWMQPARVSAALQFMRRGER